jgi:hypothetical protein
MDMYNFQLGSQCCVVSDRICFESEIYISCYMFCENSGSHARVMDVLRRLVVPVSELNTSAQGQIKPLKQNIFVSIEPKFSPLVTETRFLFHYQEQTVSTILQTSTLC